MKRERGRWTTELEDEALAKIQGGRSIGALAEDYGISYDQMRKVLLRARLARNPPKPLFKRVFGKGKKA